MSASSTGLSSRTAAALAYSGWWVTGAIFWFLERRDPSVRFHAVQAVVSFGTIALLVLIFAGLAAASLSFVPSTFTLFLTAAVGVGVGGLVLWGFAMWKAVSGDEWRIPVAADVADRLVRSTSLERASS